MKMSQKVLKFALFIALGMFLGCREGQYAPDDEFVDLYVELKLVSVASVQDPNKANEVRMAILAQHGMTPAEFHEHFLRLAAHPDTWRSFQERVVSRMDAFQKEHQNGK
jgi:hypothetical protein